MSKFILLLWISIIVILNIHGENITDNSKLCEECVSNTLPECTENNDMLYNSTINCQRSDETFCIIGVAKKQNENFEENIMCILKQSHTFARDSLNTIEEQYTTIEVWSEMEDDHKIDQEKMQISNQLENSIETDILEVTTKHFLSEASIIIEQDMNDTFEIFENTMTKAPETSNDYTILIISSTLKSEPDNISSDIYVESVINTDFSKFPQVDQGMPEVNAKPFEIESQKREENLNFEINSIDNLNPETSAKNIPICFKCNSTEDVNCITKPTREKLCKTVDKKPVGCYTRVEDAQLMRGCLEDLDASKATVCLHGSNKSCYVCYGKNCNNEPWPQCYACKSNIEEKLCIQLPPHTSTSLIKLCSAIDDVCRLDINKNGDTIRSCAANNYTCDRTEEANCKVCNSSLCNGEVIPKGRLRCHQCADATNCTLEQSIHMALPCPIFNEDDSCYFYVNDVGIMQRGCTSSLEDFEHCMKYSKNRCVTCKTFDGCNSQPLMVKSKLSCSKCDTRVKDNPSSLKCAWAQSTESVSICKDKHLYYVEETCEMIYESDIDLAVRGCSHDIGACESSYNACSDCKTNACNIGNLVWQHCLQCSSKELSSCHFDLKGIISKKCSSLKQSYEDRGCYISVNFNTNVTTRGCISELSDQEKKYCKKNKKQCVFCYEQGCNDSLAPSSANIIFMENLFRLLLLEIIYICL